MGICHLENPIPFKPKTNESSWLVYGKVQTYTPFFLRCLSGRSTWE